MQKIDPVVLKRLRTAKGWSQEKLAENTKTEGFPKIDKQTISRLERGDGGNTRGRTIEQLARALKVEPAVLTGAAPSPELELQGDPNPKSQLNVRVSRAARNAMTLVSQRYPGVNPSQIMELAPFLFCWAAEASLRHRQARLVELENAVGIVQKLERALFEVSFADFNNSERTDLLTEQITRENRSIELGDIFGDFQQEDPDHFLDVNAIDPFSGFLSDLVAEFPDISFERWFCDGSPSYVVCSEEAAQLVGGDRDLAAFILNGSVLLNEMPKEIRSNVTAWLAGRPPGLEIEARVEWVRTKAEEYAKQFQSSMDQRSEVSK
jgi:transcriptional regulator with XRE-family HTH domain